MILLIKLLALGSFLGGPLLCSDAWKPTLGSAWAFALAFAPTGLLAFAGLSLDDEPDRIQRWSLRGGVLGAVVLIAQDLVAIGVLVTEDPRFAASRTLYLIGIPIGLVAAALFLHRVRRGAAELDIEHMLRRAERAAQLRDWALLLISLAFVAAGLVLWRNNRDAAIVTIVFFAPCALVPLLSIRRRQLARVTPASTWTLPADRTLRLRRAPLALTCAGLLLGSLVILVHSTAYPWLFRAIVTGIAVLSACGLLALAWGRGPRGFIRFDATTLSLGRARYTLHIPWRAIHIAAPTEIMNNPAVLISLFDPSVVTTTPPEKHARTERELGQNAMLYGAPVVIMISSYAVTATELAAAIMSEGTRANELV